MFKIAAAVLLCLAASVLAGSNYAVLVAGSNGYYNYRHQADVCHAFQLLTQKGNFPAENIIVFMYDDIAENSQNPVKGNLINQPDGPNLYTGVNKDYVGEDCTAENFLAVLRGDKQAMNGIGSGRVLESGADDNVFVFYSDHGGVGLVAMPAGPYLYANDLVDTLKEMHTAKKYNRLAFYLEACESGSMFEDLLPTDINVFATTASTKDQSSYAFYYDATRQTYLGDEYSINWMENSDSAKFEIETLEQQFEVVANLTKESQPQQYGSVKLMGDEPIGDFQDFEEVRAMYATSDPEMEVRHANAEVANCRDVKLDVLQRRYLAAKHPKAKESLYREIEAEITLRRHADKIFTAIAQDAAREENMLEVRHPVTNWSCYKAAINAVQNTCGNMGDYSMKWTYVLNNLCTHGVPASEIAAAARRACF